MRRIPLESRAGSEPNFQPELDETPEPCVSSRHDAAKRTIGTSIGEDVPCPQEVGIVSDEHKVRSIDGVGVKPADVARAEYRLAVVKNVLQVCSEFDRGAFRHPSFLEERHVPIVKTGRIQRVAADVGPGARARAYVLRHRIDGNIANSGPCAAGVRCHGRGRTGPSITANGSWPTVV